MALTAANSLNSHLHNKDIFGQQLIIFEKKCKAYHAKKARLAKGKRHQKKEN